MQKKTETTLIAALIASVGLPSALAAEEGVADAVAQAQASADALGMGGLLVEAEDDTDDGFDVFEFKYWLAASGQTVRVDIDQATGAARDVDVRTPDADDAAEFAAIAAAVPATTISFAEAITAACGAATGDFVDVEYDFENNALVLEVTLLDGPNLIEIHVDPVTGEVIGDGGGDNPGSNPADGLRGAIVAAGDLLAGGVVTDAELDADDGVFDVDLYEPSTNMFFELEYNVATGALTKFEPDLDADDFAEVALLTPDTIALADGFDIIQALRPDGAIHSIDYDIERARLVIRAEFSDESRLRIDAMTGEVVTSGGGGADDSDDDDDDSTDLGGGGEGPSGNTDLRQSITDAAGLVDGGFVLDARIDDDVFDLDVLDPATGDQYEVEIHRSTGAVTQFELDLDPDEQDEIALLTPKTLTLAEGYDAIRAIAPEGVMVRIDYDVENAALIIRGRFDNGRRVRIDATSGQPVRVSSGGTDDRTRDLTDQLRRTPVGVGDTGGAISSATDAQGHVVATYLNDDNEVVFIEWDNERRAWMASLVDTASGERAALDTKAIFDARANRALVSIATPSALVLADPIAPAADRDLTAELPGSTPITSNLTTLTSRDGLAFIAGLDDAGDLVLYFQTNETRDDGRQVWAFTNLSRDHLEPAGLATPNFTQELITYVTNWNALTIAGLDANGDIQAVWWAPGMKRWTTNNLSEITGAAPMATGLTAYLTPWGGINLAGLDASGNVVVTWWVPRFGASWARTDLSGEFGHDGMGGMELTSYVTPWGGLNLAGLDASGELVVYWWAPGMRDWIVSPLGSLIEGATLPSDELTASTTQHGLVNLFGVSDDGDVVRYHWQPGNDWEAENIADHAQSR